MCRRGHRSLARCRMCICVLRVHAWRNAEYVGVGVVFESAVEPVGSAGDDIPAHGEDGTVWLRYPSMPSKRAGYSVLLM